MHSLNQGDDDFRESKEGRRQMTLTDGSEQGCERAEFERDVRDSKVKKAEGPKLYRQLEEYLLRELCVAKEGTGKSEYCVEYVRNSPLELLPNKHIRVQRRDKRTPPLTIKYYPSIHHLHFECGTQRWDYTLVVDEDVVIWFDTSARIRRTIQEVATEMLKGIETDNLVCVSSSMEQPGVIRRWLDGRRAAEGRR